MTLCLSIYEPNLCPHRIVPTHDIAEEMLKKIVGCELLDQLPIVARRAQPCRRAAGALSALRNFRPPAFWRTSTFLGLIIILVTGSTSFASGVPAANDGLQSINIIEDISVKDIDKLNKYQASKVLKSSEFLAHVLKWEGGREIFMKLRGIAPSDAFIDLGKTNLDGVDLRETNLEGANLHWSKIHGANFDGAVMRGAYLFHCHCQRTSFRNAQLDRSAKGKQTVLGYSYLDGADSSDADLTGADLLQSSLVGAVFDRAEIGMIEAQRSKLPYASLVDVTSENGPVDMQSVVASHANWTRAKLPKANLRNIVLASTDLTGADLRGADLQSAEMRKAVLRDTNLEDANLHNAILFYADLRRTALRGADLTDAGLLNSRLSGVDLQGAILNLVNADFADFSRANLTDVSIERSKLIGANFSGANLSGSSLFAAQLARANLSGANLTGVDFSEANLSKADLRGAILHGAIFTGLRLDFAIFSENPRKAGAVVDEKDMTKIIIRHEE